MQRTTELIVKIGAIPFLVIGGVGWFLGALTGCGCTHAIPPSFEMPLGHPEGIAVDSAGNIYCGAQFYSRVQTYNSQGQYLWGAFVGNGATFRIRINERDQLEVVTARNHRFYVFTRDGTLLRQSTESLSLFDFFGDAHDREFYDKREQATYCMVPALFRPSIVKVDSSGNRRTIIQTPFSKGLWKGPLPAWLFFMIGVGALAAAHGKCMRRKGQPSSMTTIVQKVMSQKGGKDR